MILPTQKFGFTALHGRNVELGGFHIAALGYSNLTPFNTPGEIAKAAGTLSWPEAADSNLPLPTERYAFGWSKAWCPLRQHWNWPVVKVNMTTGQSEPLRSLAATLAQVPHQRCRNTINSTRIAASN